MRRVIFSIDEFEVTTRELLASVTLLAVMTILWFVIHGAMIQGYEDNIDKYNKAFQINSQEEFEYCLKTSVGNSFSYSELRSIDPVSMQYLDGEYAYILRVHEHYTMHTRMVSSGKSHYIQIYFTWDEVGSDESSCSKVAFYGHEFSADKFNLAQYRQEMTTVEYQPDDRYVFSATPLTMQGTMFARMTENDIQDVSFYQDKNIQDTLKQLTSDVGIIVFNVIWIILTIGIEIAFLYADNKWLD